MQLSKGNRRWFIAAGAAALTAMSAGALWFIRRNQKPGVLEAAQVQGELPVSDPNSKLWQRSDRLDVTLMPQQMFYPKLKQATLSQLTVRSLYNGSQLAFLLEWGDEKQDAHESIVGFRDAAAVMLPMKPTAERPPVFMGMVGKPVYIMQWKASWQLDIDKGFQGVETAYPNWFNDVYPGHPELERLGLKGDAVKPFYPGLAVGNPLSQQQRTSPVEELTAEGFGTLTSLPQQHVQGRGMYEKGRWRVSIGLPVAGDDVPTVAPGQTIPVAFAVWDGGHRQVGGRKHFADWIQLILPGGK